MNRKQIEGARLASFDMAGIGLTPQMAREVFDEIDRLRGIVRALVYDSCNDLVWGDAALVDVEDERWEKKHGAKLWSHPVRPVMDGGDAS